MIVSAVGVMRTGRRGQLTQNKTEKSIMRREMKLSSKRQVRAPDLYLGESTEEEKVSHNTFIDAFHSVYVHQVITL